MTTGGLGEDGCGFVRYNNTKFGGDAIVTRGGGGCGCEEGWM